MEETSATDHCPACGSVTNETMQSCGMCDFPLQSEVSPFKQGTILEGRYRIDAEVGRGGMGVVYRGTDLTLSRPIAIKAMLSSRADAGVLARFMHEARSLASVENPRLVPVYAVGQEEGVYYMVMRFVPGRPLSEVLQSEGSLPESDVRRLINEVCGALVALHANGLVHRDLKPANLMVGPDGSFTVMDLGVVKSTEDSAQVASSATAGTPKYMPPEMFSNLPVDGRADLYALGVVAYHALAGRVPFDGPTPMAILYKQAHTDAEPIRRVCNDVSRELAKVIHQLLEKDPALRFPDAESLVSALSGPVPASKKSNPIPVIAFVILAVGLGWYFLRPSDGIIGGKRESPDAQKPMVAKIVDAKSRPPRPADAGSPKDARRPRPVADAAPRPAPQIHRIRISSKPAGATVFMGRKILGKTPIKLERVSDHPALRVRIVKDGFKPRLVRVNFEKSRTYSVKLRPEFKLLP